MDLNDIRALERDGKLSSENLDRLRSMREICVRHIQNADWSAVHIKQSLDDEILRKEGNEAERRWEQRHQALVAEQQQLKASIDLLAKPHWVTWATFVAGAIAAVASVIAAVATILR